ncbi:DgyrCDS5971 [Dimorphilus gyrociliatus]|uniref:U6 small nuclear RNA (adenine-(43)-N(6))-methyltransferase n=1 Tax=Dimorphilus gyrociliatus TaxID=2664684 RepID=A0A7I8VMC5_9ANNE|nr:DgyrCDS5971 [Dimorphilus gyrociliatus]
MDSLSFSPFIHPNNPIKWPSFEELAKKYKYFEECGKYNSLGKFKINVQEEKCKRQLTRSLLEHFFSLKVTLPEGRLIPALTIRVNYICWLEDMLSVCPEVSGIDIGCGASCIYPLIASARNGWQFRASEIDHLNYEYALKNIKTNSLEDMITVVKKSDDATILSDVLEDGKTYEFCMCNPPFHDNEVDDLNMEKAAPVEMITTGGEVAFYRIYTTMIGKKLSVLPIIAFLERYFSQNSEDDLICGYGLTQFCQGRVIRWGLAWSFHRRKFSKREIDRTNRKAQRDLERDRGQLEKQEKQLQEEIKRAAKRGDKQTCNILAKQLIQMRKAKTRTYTAQSKVQVMTNQTKLMHTNVNVAQTMGKTAKTMSDVNKQMDPMKTQAMLKEFSMQNAKMEMTDEMINDTLDDIMNDSADEEEQDAVVNQVLDEIGIEISGQMSKAPTAERGALGAESAKATVSDEELMKQLAQLKSS